MRAVINELSSGQTDREHAESPRTLGEMLFRAARIAPLKTAVLAEDRVLSYQELWEKSRGLAVMLQDAGLKKGDRIACLLRKTPEAIITFLGSAMSGGVFFPVDPNLPPFKMSQIFTETGAKFIIADSNYVEVACKAGGVPLSRMVVINGEQGKKYRLFSEIDRHPGSLNPVASTCVHDPVYLNFTSGSTGLPKGAVTTHANIWWNTWAAVTAFGLTPDDVHLIMFPVFVHPHEIFARSLFLAGSTILIDTVQPKTIAETITRYRATTFMAVASIYETLVRLKDISRYDFSSLRIPESGGMHVTSTLVQAFRRRFKAPLYPVWGSTETAGIAMFTPPEREYRPASMGVCCPGYEARILDESGKDVAVGEVGEMVLQGPAVCSHYCNNPRETSRYLDDGRFWTGDLAYQDLDGFYYFQSRRSNLMKVGGLKVYPVEIEEVLRGHPEVQEIAVVPSKDGLHGEVPKAVIVTKSGWKISNQDLRGFCEQKLHRYKFPRKVEFLKALPRTPGGKVAWKEL